MRIGVAQMDTRPGDFDATARRMLTYGEQAVEQGVELLVFPLAVLTGLDVVPDCEQLPFALDLARTLVDLARRLACPCIVPVTLGMDGDLLVEALFLNEGKVLPLRLAARGKEASSSRESLHQDSSSTDVARLRLGGLRLGMAFDDDDLAALAGHGSEYDVVLYLGAEGYCADDPRTALGAGLSEGSFCHLSATDGFWLIGIGSLGSYGSQVCCGASFALDGRGRPRALAPAFEEALMICDVCSEDVSPSVPSLEPEPYNPSLFLWRALVLGLYGVLEKGDGGRQVVLALDGGVPSQLLAVLATDALGPSNVHVLICPSSRDSAPRCRQLASALRVDVREMGVPPAPPSDLFGSAVFWDEALWREALIGIGLTSWARELGANVLSSADKTGRAMAGPEGGVAPRMALAPFGDVYRSDVFELARMRNTISPVMFPVVMGPADVPMPKGLQQGGRSPEELLASIDAILLRRIEWGCPDGELASSSGRSEADVAAVLAALYRSLRGSGDGLRSLTVSSRTLGEARRPSGLGWRPDLDDQDEGRIQEELEGILEHFDIPQDVAPSPEREPMVQDGAPAAPSAGDAGEELREALSFLSDFVQGGGLQLGESPLGQDADKAHGTHPWQSPFSEN